jgi:endogenous inhibitor of DNA gyrase (YacG/DUF329 family)
MIKICPNCKKEFIREVNVQKYCSKKCYKISYIKYDKGEK